MVRNRQLFQTKLRQLEEKCETTHISCIKKDLTKHRFSDTGLDYWSKLLPDCLLSSKHFKYFSLSSEWTDEEKDLVKEKIFFKVSDVTKPSVKSHPTKHRLLKYCIAAYVLLGDLTRRLVVDVKKDLTDHFKEIQQDPIIKITFQ